jgi:hypothetical protein
MHESATPQVKAKLDHGVPFVCDDGAGTPRYDLCADKDTQLPAVAPGDSGVLVQVDLLKGG